MLITRKSLISGIEHTMDLPITYQELDRWYDGELIQEVFYYLNPAEREFIKTGITEEEWETLFSEKEPQDA